MINDLEKKLSGSIPVTKVDLIELVDSWGRINSLKISDLYYINESAPKEKYDLSNLDISQINDLSYVFIYSLYNGDLSKWNISNVKRMERMFAFSEFNNDSLKDLDISNVNILTEMFYGSFFNGDVSNWNVENINNMFGLFSCSKFNRDISQWKFNADVSCINMFYGNENFEKKYNDRKRLPYNTEKILEWFEENRNKMREINTTKEDVLDFFSFNSNIEKEIK